MEGAALKFVLNSIKMYRILVELLIRWMNSIDFVIFTFLVNKLCKGHTKEIDNENKMVKMIYSVKIKCTVNADMLKQVV